MKKHDLPAMPFYFGDWRKCPEVQSLEPDVRMMWFDMLGYMWESTERGYLTLGGKAIPENALARLLGMDPARLSDGLTTMDNLSVFSRRESDGAIYCRRMVKEEARRQQNRKNGSKGGNPLLSVKGGVGKSVNRNPNQLSEDETENAIESDSKAKAIGFERIDLTLCGEPMPWIQISGWVTRLKGNYPLVWQLLYYAAVERKADHPARYVQKLVNDGEYGMAQEVKVDTALDWRDELYKKGAT